MPTLFIPVGIPGCGKSSLATYIGSCDVVSSDAIRARMGDVNDQSRNGAVFARYHQDIEAWLGVGRNVYADATNLDARSRQSLRDIVYHINENAYGPPYTKLQMPVRMHLILFRNLSQAITRNTQRERVVPADAMIRMIEKYERAVAAIEHEVYDYVTEVSAVR